MIGYRETKEEISVFGNNNGADILGGFCILFPSAFLVVIITNLLININLLLSFILLLIIPCLYFIMLKKFLKFRIDITRKKLFIEKSFSGIVYRRIEKYFDSIDYNAKNLFISFIKDRNESVSIENLVGFEGDYLLIMIKNKQYEIGDKADADLIFGHLEKGLKTLALI